MPEEINGRDEPGEPYTIRVSGIHEGMLSLFDEKPIAATVRKNRDNDDTAKGDDSQNQGTHNE